MRPLFVLERFEDRCTPASVRAAAGNLLISDPVGPLTVSVLAAGVVNVADGATNATFSGIGSLISIRGTDLNDRISFRSNTVAFFPGTLVVATYNGDDVVDISGRLGGNVTIVTGNGNDAVVSTGANVRIGGNLTVADVAGANAWQLNGRDWTVGRDLTYYGLTGFAMGPTGVLRVGGYASLTAIQPVASTMSLLFDGLFTKVGKTLAITGGSVTNLVSITSGLFVGGNLFVSERGGVNNIFNLSPLLGGDGVQGTLYYTGGIGPDSVVVGTNAAIGGNTSFNLDNGTNSLVDGAGASYGGDVTVFGGNNMTTVGFNGTIDGNLNLYAGNGTNSVTLTRTLAGIFRYRGGNGADLLRLRGAGVYHLDAAFGTGANVFDTDRVGLVLNGTVMGGRGDNTFNQGAATLLPSLTLVNFPVG